MDLIKDFQTVQEIVPDPDLSMVRKHARRDISADEVWCGAFAVCNTKVDRMGERFTKAYLDRFRETLPGKSLLEGHNTQTRALGRFYNAEVLHDGNDWYLKGYYYTAADSPIVREIELGIAKDCSIGYKAGKRTCSLDGKLWLPYRQGECKDHQPLQEYDGKSCVIDYCDSEVHKAEAHEVSLVYLGCQYGAEAIAKTFFQGLTDDQRRFWMLGTPLPPAPPQEESGMFDTLEKAVAEVERLKKLPLAAEREAELQKAIADKEPLVKDGATYRQAIRDNIARMALALDEADKHQGKTAAKAEMYTAILATMPVDSSAESLLAVEKGLKSEFEARFAQSAAHGNGPEPHKEEEKPGLLRRLAAGGYW